MVRDRSGTGAGVPMTHVCMYVPGMLGNGPIRWQTYLPTYRPPRPPATDLPTYLPASEGGSGKSVIVCVILEGSSHSPLSVVISRVHGMVLGARSARKFTYFDDFAPQIPKIFRRTYLPT